MKVDCPFNLSPYGWTIGFGLVAISSLTHLLTHRSQRTRLRCPVLSRFVSLAVWRPVDAAVTPPHILARQVKYPPRETPCDPTTTKKLTFVSWLSYAPGPLRTSCPRLRTVRPLYRSMQRPRPGGERGKGERVSEQEDGTDKRPVPGYRRRQTRRSHGRAVPRGPPLPGR